MAITYKQNQQINTVQLGDLFETVTQVRYSHTQMKQTLDYCLFTISAYDNQDLVGFVRVVGDGYRIIYIEDLLVHPQYEHLDIQERLFSRVLRRFKHVDEIVMITLNDTNITTHLVENNFKKINTTRKIVYHRVND